MLRDAKGFSCVVIACGRTDASANCATSVYGVPIEAWFDGEKEEGGCGHAAFAALTQTAKVEWNSLLLTWYALGESDPRPTD